MSGLVLEDNGDDGSPPEEVMDMDMQGQQHMSRTPSTIKLFVD